MNGRFIIDPNNIRADRSSTRWFTPFYGWDNHYEVVISGTDKTFGYTGPAVLAAQAGYGKIIATP